MKSKQLKEYLGKVITYKTVWNTFGTGKLIELIGNFATFENDSVKTNIKIFNIVQVQSIEDYI